MAAAELKDNSARLFGRAKDLERLHARAARTGLTAVIGPAQMGKSWLLTELARQLAESPSPRRIVGFSRSPKGAHDPLLQVVADLYQRWLSEATARQRAYMAGVKQKDRALPAFARFIGKLAEKAGKTVPGLGEIGGTAIKEALEGLVRTRTPPTLSAPSRGFTTSSSSPGGSAARISRTYWARSMATGAPGGASLAGVVSGGPDSVAGASAGHHGTFIETHSMICAGRRFSTMFQTQVSVTPSAETLRGVIC